MNRALTVVLALVIAAALVPFAQWALIDAVWRPDANACRAAHGACWGFIVEKHRFILFGTYPYDEQWRPALATVVLLALWVASAVRAAWRPWLAALWAAGLLAIGLLMWGGVLGLPYVENERWGGLILTLLLTTIGLAAAFPLSIALALGRRSQMPVMRALSVAYIELIRGVPLISLLFMASVMLPLFLPGGMTIDKLARAQIALVLFAAAYLAEVVRGGLQAIPRGQYDAAAAVGLGYWDAMRSVILPQALRIAVPPLVNTFIGFFKDTSLVLIIGIFDFLNTANQALVDPAWAGYPGEVYLFAAFVYFCFCYSMSRYSKYLEVELNKGTRR
jgi:general L-amino acid transport system permease protein